MHAVTRHIRGKYPDLAIGDLTRRARVLAGHPARRLALLQKAGLVYDQNRIVIAKRFQGVVAHNIAQPIRIPISATQDRLLTPRANITGRFRAHPARHARFIAHQSVHILPRAAGHTLLTKQRTNSPLHIHKRRFTDRQRPPKRGSRHPCSSESWWPIDSESAKKTTVMLGPVLN